MEGGFLKSALEIPEESCNLLSFFEVLQSPEKYFAVAYILKDDEIEPASFV
jgi:hypothetical protein